MVRISKRKYPVFFHRTSEPVVERAICARGAPLPAGRHSAVLELKPVRTAQLGGAPLLPSSGGRRQ